MSGSSGEAPGPRDPRRPDPPRLLEALLVRLLPSDAGEVVAGDLREEYARIREERGAPGAWIWYGWQSVAIPLRFGAAGATDGPGLVADIRIAARRARRDPGFVAVVVTAIALGIGVNATILSVASALFIDPRPDSHSHRLGFVAGTFSGSPTDGYGVSVLNMRDVRERVRTVDRIALFADWSSVALSGEGPARQISATFADTGYPELLELETVRGRLFTAAEARPGSDARVAVLGHGTWVGAFGGEPEIVGRTIHLNGEPMLVIGVLSRGRPDLRARTGQSSGVLLPLASAEAIMGWELEATRGSRYLNALIRIRPDASIDAARRELQAISTDLTRIDPAENEGWSYSVEPLAAALYDDLRTPAAVLLAGSVLVLLLVCVNLAVLFLVRGLERTREMAMRRTLGAGVGRLGRQLVTESLLLTFAGGAAGLLLAGWGVDLFLGLPGVELPAFAEVSLDHRVLLVSVAAVVAAGLVFGLVPLRRLSDAPLDTELRAGGRHGESRSSARTRRILVAAQVALAFVLLVGAGLVAESFRTLRSTGYGFDADDLLAARTELRGDRFEEPSARLEFADALLRRASALPGVEAAFLWAPNRLGHGNWVELLVPEGRWESHPEERLEASRHHIRPGTLKELGIPLLRGRDFDASDDASGPRVAIVSESLADALWPGENPLGRRVESRRNDGIVYEVVGVVADVRHRTRLYDPFGPQWDVYLAYDQEPPVHQTVVMRLADDAEAAAVVPALREVVAELAPSLPLHDVTTLEEQMRQEEARYRISALVVGIYALLAVALAALGVYGVLAHGIRRRTREIGIRRALGAHRGRLVGGVLRSGLGITGIGAAVGLLGALAGARLLSGALYGIEPWDPRVFAFVAVLLTGVAAAACVVPAVRAVRIEPREALRAE